MRPRIFFEGNLFLDVRPGTPGTPEVEDGGTPSRSSQTSAPVQIDQVLGTLKTDTRKDLQKLLIGYGDALERRAAAGRGRRPGFLDRGRDRRRVAQRLAGVLGGRVARSGGRERRHPRHRAARPLEAGRAASRRSWRRSRSNEGQLKGLITNFNITMAALASRAATTCARPSACCRSVLEAASPALDNLNAAFPSTRAWALEMIPGVRETPATIEAGVPVDHARRARCCRPASCRGSWTTSARQSTTCSSSSTAS